MGDYDKTRAAAAAVTQKHGQALAGLEDVPKRLWHAIDDFGRVSTDIDAHVKPDGSIAAALQEFHHADLSADLVRAAWEAAANDAHNMGNKFLHDYFRDRAADPEARAAIVAQVMERE